MFMAKYKLIIVDDEALVVKGLKETVDWAALDLEVVATATDGNKGLDAIHRYKPDLVISDIRMPIADGLTLSRKLAEEKFDCALIIYSGFSDFEYVSRAMEYGVMRYLLKPIENDLLIQKVREVLAELEVKRENAHAVRKLKTNLPMLQENLTHKLLNDPVGGGAAYKLKELGVEVPKEGVVISCKQLVASENETFAVLYKKVKESLEGFTALGCMSNDEFAVITGLCDVDVIYQSLKILLGALKELRVTVGVSSPYGESQSLTGAYKEAIGYRDGYLFPTVNNLASKGMGGAEAGKTVEAAIRLIEKNYAVKLSVKDAAAKLYVSESHLMHEFKENIGKTFNECLTDYRMIKAKEFLSSGTYRIKEVAYAVGYSDVKYFGQIFKEKVGVSPAEFAETVSRK